MTSLTLAERVRAHRAKHREGNTSRFHAAMRKYGVEAFSWCVLIDGLTVVEAYDKERELIALLKPEYNVCPGGIGGATGVCHNRKMVVCLEDRTIFSSVKLAAEAHALPISCISSACNGKVRVANEKHFVFMDCVPDANTCDAMIADLLKRQVQERRRVTVRTPFIIALGDRDRLGRRLTGPRKRQRPVRCITSGEVFNNAGEAAVKLDISLTAIREMCLGQRNRKSAGGMAFEYVVT